MVDPEASEQERLDAAMAEWRQGDFTREGEYWIPVVVSSGGQDAAAEETTLDAAAEIEVQEVHGLVALTQTCDLVRSCSIRPYVQFSPLVPVSGNKLHLVKSGYHPSLGFLPGASDHGLVADLTRVVTFEKSVVAEWNRERGCASAADRRQFAQALARVRARPAFPEDFNRAIAHLATRIKRKHKRPNSPEGRALRALQEIRVFAEPSWDADEVTLQLWFIRNEFAGDSTSHDWPALAEKWIGLVEPDGRFRDTSGMVVDLEDLTAAEYLGSDRLDLDHLSEGGG